MIIKKFLVSIVFSVLIIPLCLGQIGYDDVGLEITSLDTNLPSPQPAGSQVTWTAIASNPGGFELEYMFELEGPRTVGKSQIMKDWSPDNTWTWKSDKSDIGDNKILAQVRDGNLAKTSGLSEITTVTSLSDANYAIVPTPKCSIDSIIRGSIVKIVSDYILVSVKEVIDNELKSPSLREGQFIYVRSSNQDSLSRFMVGDCIEAAGRLDADSIWITNDNNCNGIQLISCDQSTTTNTSTSTPNGPLTVYRYENGGGVAKIWIENPAPYYTFVPITKSDGTPNFAIKGIRSNNIQQRFSQTGALYEKVVEFEELYKFLKPIKDIYTIYKIIVFPPISLVEVARNVGEIVEISGVVPSPEDLVLSIAKDNLNGDEAALYLFNSWFLEAKDPESVINSYGGLISGGGIWFKPNPDNPSEPHAPTYVTDTIDARNRHDQFWPRGWKEYKNRYGLPKANGYVLSPNSAIIFVINYDSSEDIKESELELTIEEYQSLETLDAEPDFNSEGYLKDHLRVWLPSFTLIHGDKQDTLINTLSCIYNGNYERSEYMPLENTEEYRGTGFDHHYFRATSSEILSKRYTMKL